MKDNDLRVIDVKVNTDRVHFSLEDGRELGVPVDWYPRLDNAPLSELRKFKLNKIGNGVIWENLDVYILVEDVLFYGRNASGNRPADIDI